MERDDTDRTPISIWTKVFLGLVVFSIAGTILTAQTGLDPGPIKPAASILAIASGVVALARHVKPWKLVAVLVLGTIAEVVGLYTGFPFGKYRYTDAWWPTVSLPGGHLFPLLLPFAWFLVAGGCVLAMRPLGKACIFFAPFLATGIDLFLMEHVMVSKLHYWEWLERGPFPGRAPFMNPFGWLLTSFAAAFILWDKEVPGLDAVWVVGGYLALVAGLWVGS